MRVAFQGVWEPMAIARLIEESSDRSLFLVGKSRGWADECAARIRSQVDQFKARQICRGAASCQVRY